MWYFEMAVWIYGEVNRETAQIFVWNKYTLFSVGGPLALWSSIQFFLSDQWATCRSAASPLQTSCAWNFSCVYNFVTTNKNVTFYSVFLSCLTERSLKLSNVPYLHQLSKEEDVDILVAAEEVMRIKQIVPEVHMK